MRRAQHAMGERNLSWCRAKRIIIRLVGAVLAEQTDEWAEGHRYMGHEILARSRLHPITTSGDTTETKHIMAPDELTA